MKKKLKKKLKLKVNLLKEVEIMNQQRLKKLDKVALIDMIKEKDIMLLMKLLMFM